MEAEERAEPEAAPEPHEAVSDRHDEPSDRDGGEPAEGGEGEPAEPAGEPAEPAEPAKGSSEEGELFVCVKRAQARAGRRGSLAQALLRNEDDDARADARTERRRR